MSNNDFLASVQAAAAETGKDHTKTAAGGEGGGDYTPPPMGKARARFIGYVETGKHTTTWQGKPKTKNEVRCYFELSGPKYPPREIDGKQYPHIVVIEENLTFNEKGNWPKVFAKLNYGKSATHPVQLLGNAYLVTVNHKKWAKKGEDKTKPETWTGVDVTLRGNDGAYNIEPPQFEDPETGETKSVAVAPAITPLMAFIWDNPSKAMWDSIYIPGEYPERKDKEGNVVKPAAPKNTIQLRIRAADNFKGSPVDELLKANGVVLDLAMPEEEPDGGPTAQAEEKPDPLAGAAKKSAKGKGFDELEDDIPF